MRWEVGTIRPNERPKVPVDPKGGLKTPIKQLIKDRSVHERWHVDYADHTVVKAIDGTCARQRITNPYCLAFALVGGSLLTLCSDRPTIDASTTRSTSLPRCTAE